VESISPAASRFNAESAAYAESMIMLSSSGGTMAGSVFSRGKGGMLFYR